MSGAAPGSIEGRASWMAAGGWMGGLLYDRFGGYAVAFEAGVVSNMLNLMLIGLLVMREHGGRVSRVVVMP